MPRAAVAIVATLAACTAAPPAPAPVVPTTAPPAPSLPPSSPATPPVAAETGAAPARVVAPAPRVPPVPTGSDEPGGGGAADVLACIRSHESGGNYGAVSRSGGHRGAYQFARSTWDGVAARHRPDLVGVDPAGASVADQDAMAGYLLAERGLQPWSVRGRCA